jgi:hypothetical protein
MAAKLEVARGGVRAAAAAALRLCAGEDDGDERDVRLGPRQGRDVAAEEVKKEEAKGDVREERKESYAYCVSVGWGLAALATR